MNETGPVERREAREKRLPRVRVERTGEVDQGEKRLEYSNSMM